MIRRNMKWLPVVLVAGVALTAACKNDLLEPPTSSVDSLFNKYVSLGNSITAGIQSAGISDSTQNLTYAAILAEQMGVEFNMPLMNRPGCPPPYVNVFTQDRGGYADDDCFLRVAPIPELLHNVAVPGAAVVDALTNLGPTSDPNPLTTFFLGGRTQVEAAALVRPTFVSVWIGSNDVLGAILDEDNPGDPLLVTPPTAFAASYAAMMDSLDAIGSIQGGVLIGAVQAVFAPYLTQGRAYFQAAATIPLPTLTVLGNCLTDFTVIPGTTDTLWVSVPFAYGGPIFGAAALGVPQTLDCSVPQVVSSAEMLNMVGAVDAYNTAIAAEATARGWAFLDPNTLLEQLLPDPTAIRPFPAFNPLDPQHETAPFGWAVSRDGIHPSTVTHESVAEALIALINATYGTAIPEP